MKPESKTVHWGDRRRNQENYVPVTTPIHTATTYFYESMEELERVFTGEDTGPSYTRYDNPTRTALEELMRELENAASAVACASGMAALHMAILAALIDRPKRVLAANALYGSTPVMLLNIFGPMGVESQFVDICDLAAVEAAVAEFKPGAIVMETVSNPLLRVGEIDKLAAIARNAGAVLIVDATFTTPLLMRPLDLGAGMVIHSATKYLAGHGDVLGGVIATDAENQAAVRALSRTMGPAMGPFESYLTMRGIKTLALRLERQCFNACKVASSLAAHPRVDRVYFTGDPAHPDAVTIARLFPKGQYGAMLSFELKDAAQPEVFRFMDNLKMIVRATSLGDVHTMTSYPAMSSHRELTATHRRRLGIRDNLIRLSIGIEAAEDIIEDIEQALVS